MEESQITNNQYNFYQKISNNLEINIDDINYIGYCDETLLYIYITELSNDDIIKLLNYNKFNSNISYNIFTRQFTTISTDTDKTALEVLFETNDNFKPELLLDLFIDSKLFNCKILSLKQNFIKIINILNENSNDNFKYNIFKKIVSHPTFDFNIFTNVFDELIFLYRILFNVFFDCHNEKIIEMNNEMFLNNKTKRNYTMLTFIAKYEPSIIIDIFESQIFDFRKLIELRDEENESFIHDLLPYNSDVITFLELDNYSDDPEIIDIYNDCCNEHYND